MTAPTRPAYESVREPRLYVAFELGKKEWKLALTSGFGVVPLVRTMASGDLRAVERVIQEGRMRLGVPASSQVVSCYEAGRDGFWIHRALTQLGIQNRVVDSASIEVNRRARRTKTDRIDALKLVMMLVRVCSGESRVWAEVRVPSVEAEAARHRSRERTGLIQERPRLRNQIGSWLLTWGCRVSLRARCRPQWWTRAQDWRGTELPPSVQGRIARAEARLTVLAEQIDGLETAQRAETRAAPAERALGRLVRIKGVSTTSAAVLLEEGLVWREFRNRREVGGLLGFAPVHYDSGERSRDQGISRGQWPPAVGEYSAGMELGALAAAERADAVVSIALRAAEAGAPHRHRGARAQTAHRAVAVCHDGGRAGGRGGEIGGGGRAIRPGGRHARGAYDLCGVALSDRHGEGTAAPVSGSRLHCLRSRAIARARIEGDAGSGTHDDRRTPRDAEGNGGASRYAPPYG